MSNVSAAQAVDVLFIDMNSYFASVEQQDRPELRDRPVAVVAVDAPSTACIAASYEAKALGIRTGTRAVDARLMCRGLKIIVARPERYIEVHHQIRAAVDSCLPIEAVESIDEMWCKLLRHERDPAEAVRIGMRVKRAIADRCGPYLKCSLGLAPNRFFGEGGHRLAKARWARRLAAMRPARPAFGSEPNRLARNRRRHGATVAAVGDLHRGRPLRPVGGGVGEGVGQRRRTTVVVVATWRRMVGAAAA